MGETGELEWTNELAIRLMTEYKNRPELWDPSNEMYRVQTLKYESWREIAAIFECDTSDLRKKLNSLFASHRRERCKVRRGGHSRWFLYPHMSFLRNNAQEEVVTVSAQRQQQTNRRKEVQQPLQHEEEEEEEDSDHNDNDDDIISNDVIEQVTIKQEADTKSYKARARPQRRVARPIRRKDSDLATANIDSRLSEALRLLRRADISRRKDECDSFGEYIADSLRKHDDKTQSMIKQAINNILFEQEMKKYSNINNHYTVVLSTLEENPLILDGTSRS